MGIQREERSCSKGVGGALDTGQVPVHVVLHKLCGQRDHTAVPKPSGQGEKDNSTTAIVDSGSSIAWISEKKLMERSGHSTKGERYELG
jgi:hypothetical protein